MTEIVTLRRGDHVAYLDTLTGEGAMVLPDPRRDVPPPVLGLSVQAAEWNQMIRELYRLGWEPARDDDDTWIVVGTTADGRQAIGLHGRDPVISDPSIEQRAEAWERICRAAGIRLSGGDA